MDAECDQGAPAPALTLIEFPRMNLQDIPARLRRLADEVEQGMYGEVDSVAVAVSGETVIVLGFGGTGLHSHCALLHAGALHLTRLVADACKSIENVERGS